jgi:adenine deaminase
LKNTSNACATLLQRTLSIEICQSPLIKSFGGALRVSDFEELERQGEILALVRMMRYAGQVANGLDVPQATSLIEAAQAALLLVLGTEFPMLSAAHLNALAGDTYGHC